MAVAPITVVLPVVSHPVPAVHPVTPHLRTIALHVGTTGELSAAGFSMVGVSWVPSSATSLDVAVRTRANGVWSNWTDLGGRDDASPDDNAVDVRGHRVWQSTAPYWAPRSDGVQVNVKLLSGPAPRGLRLDLVDPGTSAADKDLGVSTPASSAFASTSQPYIYSRAQWGANESLRSYNGADCAVPNYASTIKIAFVHHTDTSNSYTSADVPSSARSN